VPVVHSPAVAVVIAAAVVVFVVAVAYLRTDPGSVRVAYCGTVLFVSLFVGLAALGGLAHALGVAIANPTGPCDEVRPAGLRAQAPPPRIPFPSFAPGGRLRIPSFVPRFPVRPGEPLQLCGAVSGRGRATPEAIRSGILLLVAAAVVGFHARELQRLVKGGVGNAG